ncbi:MAG: CvpA family protein [Clostridiales bacterium]|nr:CvpA family protein [Clostridiales bacterium]
MIDILALLIIAICVLAAFYRGAVFSLLSLGATLLSIVLALLLVVPVGRAFRKSEELYSSLLYYFEGNEYINRTSVEMVRQRAENTTAEELDRLIFNGEVPMPIDKAIKHNVLRQSYASEDVVLLGDYFNRSVVNSVIYILTYLFLFVVFRIIFGFILRLRDFARGGFPLLKRFNAPFCCGLGFLEGVFFLFAAFMLAPVILVVLPRISEVLDKSLLGRFFYQANLLLRILPKV